MKFFWNWVDKKIKQAKYGRLACTAVNTVHPDDDINLASDKITFNLYEAAGGTVVELLHRKRFENYAKQDIALYVIGSEEDIGKSLNKILTLEKLRR